MMDGWVVFCPDKCKKQPKRKEEEGLLHSNGFSSVCMLFLFCLHISLLLAHSLEKRNAGSLLVDISGNHHHLLYTHAFVCVNLCSMPFLFSS